MPFIADGGVCGRDFEGVVAIILNAKSVRVVTAPKPVGRWEACLEEKAQTSDKVRRDSYSSWSVSLLYTVETRAFAVVGARTVRGLVLTGSTNIHDNNTIFTFFLVFQTQ